MRLIRGALGVEMFAPRGLDGQQPKLRNESPVGATGQGVFVHGNEASGSALAI